jgi:replication factor C small subunit
LLFLKFRFFLAELLFYQLLQILLLESMKKEFFISCTQILKNEKIAFDPKVIANIIQRIFPDMRKTLNELQKYAQQDALNDMGLIKDLSSDEEEFYMLLKDKKIIDIKKYVSGVGDAQSFYSQLHDTYFKYVEPKDIPEFIILLSKYSYELNFVADSRINLMAFAVEVAMNCSVKNE